MDWSVPGYDTAQVCLDGHLVNRETQLSPEKSKKFCPKCGQKTVTECQACQTPIKGQYNGFEGVRIMGDPPAYCDGCGAPYPWTIKKLETAKTLAGELEGLDEAEKTELKDTLVDLVTETPRTAAAATRFKRLMKKATGPARQFLIDLIAQCVAATTKEMMKP